MNFGQNLYNWFLSNAQSLVLMAIVVIGVYLGFKREFSKLIGFLVIALIDVGLVLNAAGVKDVSQLYSGLILPFVYLIVGLLVGFSGRRLIARAVTAAVKIVGIIASASQLLQHLPYGLRHPGLGTDRKSVV